MRDLLYDVCALTVPVAASAAAVGLMLQSVIKTPSVELNSHERYLAGTIGWSVCTPYHHYLFNCVILKTTCQEMPFPMLMIIEFHQMTYHQKNMCHLSKQFDSGSIPPAAGCPPPS